MPDFNEEKQVSENSFFGFFFIEVIVWLWKETRAFSWIMSWVAFGFICAALVNVPIHTEWWHSADWINWPYLTLATALIIIRMIIKSFD